LWNEILKHVFDIIANITQIPHYISRECAGSFHFKHDRIKSYYGHSCWWLPVGDCGFKIWHGDKQTLEYKIKMWELLKSMSNNSKPYLPKVLSYLHIKHTGYFVKGGRVRTYGYNKDKIYPAFFMRNYPRPECVELAEMEVIKNSFLEDGINLHHDTFRREQLGMNNGSFVVLDINDTKNEVYL
jgi:hypothetical protein